MNFKDLRAPPADGGASRGMQQGAARPVAAGTAGGAWLDPISLTWIDNSRGLGVRAIVEFQSDGRARVLLG